ncbi:MAG: hypothetical protein AAFV26_07625, partial [Pseudomonadota bacterium]
MTKATNIVKAATGLTLAGLVAIASASAANAQYTVETYGQTKHWKVGVFTKPSGEFSHCVAIRKQPGPNKILVAKVGPQWGVQFMNKKWAFGPQRKTTAKLIVDGKRIAPSDALIGTNNVVFMLGMGRQAIAAIENSRWVRFVSERGRKIGYTLRGTKRAFDMVEACVAENTRTPAAAEAPAQPPQPPTVAAPAAPASGPQYVGNKNVIPQAPRPQASATAPAPQIGDGKNVIPPRSAAAPQTPAQAEPASTAPQAASSKPVRLDRAATLEVVSRYLGEGSGYTIASSGKGTFSNFVVNWKLKSGVLGAMSVYANQGRSTDAILGQIVAGEKKTCASGLKVSRETRAAISEGLQKIATAAMSCKKTNGTAVFTYQIV